MSRAARVAVVVGLGLSACGAEDEHEHEPSDFATRADCEEHYRAEGHDDDEVAALCKDVPA